MDKRLQGAIEAARKKKERDAEASREAEASAHTRKVATLKRAIKAALPMARRYVQDVLIPRIAKAAVQGETKLRIGSSVEAFPITPHEALAKAVNEIEGLRAYTGHHEGEYHEGWGYDTYDYVEVSWTNSK